MRNRPIRPTIADVAKQACLSVSTVDRVLNARAPVSDKTANRVFEAAQALGYDTRNAASQDQNSENLTPCRLGFLLQNPEQVFYSHLSLELENAVRIRCALQGRSASTPVASARIDFITDTSPQAIAAQIQDLARHCDVLALVCYEHPGILRAIESAEARGVRIFALLSPLGPHPLRPYIGLNNRKVGRTAAWAITHLGNRRGTVGIFVGSHRFVGHELREMGFRSYCREHAPEIKVLEPLVSLDDPAIACRGTEALLSTHADLCGIYVAGGGMEGVIRALRDAQLDRPLCVITQEMTPDSHQALIDQVITLVVATPLRQLATDTVAQMISAAHKGGPNTSTTLSLPLELPFVLYTAENC